MKKKIDLFWYWFIFVVAFVLCFFAVNDNKITAYHLDDSGNVVSDNLFNGELQSGAYIFADGNYTWTYDYRSNKSLINVNSGSSIVLSFNGDINRFGSGFVFYNNGIFVSSASNTFTAVVPSGVNQVGFNLLLLSVDNDNVTNIQLEYGSVATPYEPFGVWYNENLVGDLATGVISFNSASLTYDNRDYGTSHSIADVSSYIDSSFGYLYFERLWQYLDSLTSSEYENAWLTLQLNNKMNLNTNYILNAMFNNGNYGVGAKFYQGTNLILDVTNWVNNNYAYCNETGGATCSVQLSNFVNVGDRPDLQNSFTYFDRIEIWSGDTDKRTGSFGFQNISYSQGYNSGYDLGYLTGSSNGETIGYNKGYNNGYLYGYEKGVDAVDGTDNTLVGLVGGILTAPVNMLKTIFDFEFLGINLTHFIFSIVSLFIVIWLIKIFL